MPSVEIVLVASNKPSAGIDFAAARGLPTALIDRQTNDSRQAQETALAKTIEAAAADWIFLAGYMAVLSADFVGRFTGRILNIHPSLLPKYKGLNTHSRALEAGDRFAGCSVHYVTPDFDGGQVLGQAVVPILKNDDAKSLAARVLIKEHCLYPLVLRRVMTGNAAPVYLT